MKLTREQCQDQIDWASAEVTKASRKLHEAMQSDADQKSINALQAKYNRKCSGLQAITDYTASLYGREVAERMLDQACVS